MGQTTPGKVTPHPLGINTYADSTIVSKTMVPSIDLEDGLRMLITMRFIRLSRLNNI